MSQENTVPVIKYRSAKEIPEEKQQEVLAGAIGLIRQLRFYGHINHDRPKDYKELCDTFFKEHNIDNQI